MDSRFNGGGNVRMSVYMCAWASRCRHCSTPRSNVPASTPDSALVARQGCW